MNWSEHLWHKHPGVRTGNELTLGERAADKMRNGMGSWLFIFSFIGIMCAWAVINSILIARVIHGHPFDPYPYILLNLMLSTLAGLQGGILLIAAKRADQISSELAMHDYEVNKASLEYHKQTSLAVMALCDHLQVDIPDNVRQSLTNPDKIPVPVTMLG